MSNFQIISSLPSNMQMSSGDRGEVVGDNKCRVEKDTRNEKRFGGTGDPEVRVHRQVQKFSKQIS